MGFHSGFKGLNAFVFSADVGSVRQCKISAKYGCSVTVSLGYGYIVARTDTTQQTNIYLDTQCRNVWLHLNRRPFYPLQRRSNPLSTAAGIWPDRRLKQTHLVGARQSGEITFQSYRFEYSR